MSARSGGARRRPELSQHFLRRGALARRLVEQAAISSRDLVLEIGPGTGALTSELARRCRRLVAIEIDGGLCRTLRSRFRRSEHVTIVHGDFLRSPLPEGVPFKIVGNVPFNRTSEIVRRVTEASDPPTDVHVIVQREAAERFAGAPFAGESLASLLLKPSWHVEISARLKRSDFEPAPSVDCVVLWLARRGRPLVAASRTAEYETFVRSCFGRGGRSVGEGLRAVFTRKQLRRLAVDLRFDPGAAPSELTFDQWLGLFRFQAGRGRPGGSG